MFNGRMLYLSIFICFFFVLRNFRPWLAWISAVSSSRMRLKFRLDPAKLPRNTKTDKFFTFLIHYRLQDKLRPPFLHLSGNEESCGPRDWIKRKFSRKGEEGSGMEVRQLLRNPLYMPHLSRQVRIINGGMITRLVLVSNRVKYQNASKLTGLSLSQLVDFVNIFNYSPFSAIEIKTKIITIINNNNIDSY